MASSAGLRRRGNAPAAEAGDTGGKIGMKQVRDSAAAGRVTMVIDGMAYDFTDFAKDHPGGPDYLRKNGGKVATEEFVASHPVDIIERTLTSEQLKAMTIGEIDQSTVEKGDVAEYTAGQGHDAENAASSTDGTKPTLESCINIYDFEAIASRTVPTQGWVYYSSGSDDEITLRENHNAYHRLWLKPRVMVNVKDIDMSQTILGHKCSMPMFLSAVAMCKLGHPDGEKAWNIGAGLGDIIYMIPTLSGCSFNEIVDARVRPDQPMFFQLYVNQDKEKVKKIVQKAEAAGCSALFITCDAPQLGNRERDRRVKVSHSGAAAQGGKSGGKNEGTSKALTTFIDPSLSWDDLPFFKSITKMKIVLKGIGTKEDAVRAYKEGCAGVLLSNHGGRQLDFARSAIEVLPEVMQALRDINYDESKFEVFVDGGIRRGSDIFKALALGAKAVGVGRPALYAMSAFGADGVKRMIDIFKSELHLTMQLMGTPSLKDIKEESVITNHLGSHIATVPVDMLQRETYIPPVTQARANNFERAGQVSTASVAPAAPAGVSTKAVSGAVEPSTINAAIKLVVEVIKELAKTIVVFDLRAAIGRTAIFLILFLVVHLAGNLSIFAGKEKFNQYTYLLNTPPVGYFIKATEYYLLAAAVVHMGVGATLTLKYNKLKPSKKDPLWAYPLGQAKLALTGTVIAGFLVLHILHFRLSDSGQSLHTLTSKGIDLHGEVLATLKSNKMAAFYALSSVLVGVHLWSGWAKTVNKMDFSGESKALKQPVVAIGQALTAAVTLGFVAVAYEANRVANL